MIAIIFEVIPAEGKKDAYLDIAAEMRPMVHDIEGFISVERFQSLTNPEKLLSISFFEDEDAVQRWRQLAAHRGHSPRGARASLPITGSRCATSCAITACSTAMRRQGTAAPRITHRHRPEGPRRGSAGRSRKA